VLSYAIGAPLTAYMEYTNHVVSLRFGLPPSLLYSTCAVQFLASIGVVVRSLAPWAAAALTVITVGAIASHLKIGSPLTALPAVVYTVIQVWFGLRSRQ
jgi:uncharacterized membrane protein YphA (DoxX/SURF4 family)